MEDIEFTDHEIKEQLAALGYFDVSQSKLQQFRKDLTRLVHHDVSSGNSSWHDTTSSSVRGNDGSPLFTTTGLAGRPHLSRYQPHVKVSPTRKIHQAKSPVLKMDSTVSHNLETSKSQDSGTVEPSYTYYKQTSDNNRVFEYVHKDDDDNQTAAHSSHHQVPPLSYIPQSSVSPQHAVNYGSTFSDRETLFKETTDIEPSRFVDTSDTGSMNAPTKLIRKRKVIRKQQDGTSQVFDESLMSDGSESFRNHNISNQSIDDEAVRYGMNNRLALPQRPQSARLFTNPEYDFKPIRNDPLPSFIRPNTANPHTRNIKKTDPVNKYFKYKSTWDAIKAPGERSHKDLRWQVKAQMMCKDEPAPKPQRIYVPNTYVVPTSKKRSALRWEVRHALERGYPVPPVFGS